MISNLAEYGNTSAASIPLALDEAVRSGSIKQGDVVRITHHDIRVAKVVLLMAVSIHRGLVLICLLFVHGAEGIS